MRDIKEELNKIKFPVVILSSRAGMGNFSAGKAVHEMLGYDKRIYHYCVEELISYPLLKREFLRYRTMCTRHRWILYIMHRMPINYVIKYLKELFFKSTDLECLEHALTAIGAKVVIATNNRAAFWATSLRRRKKTDYEVWAFFTDYCITPGWRFIFWKFVDRVFGVFSPDSIRQSYIRSKYSRIEMPVLDKYRRLSVRPGDRKNVLISGGGWGLGEIFDVTLGIYREVPSVNLHVAVGDNNPLFDDLRNIFAGNGRVFIYKDLDSLERLMAVCACVITKPGGITIAEACIAQRKLFLIKGLPGAEESNLLYAERHFGAETFSYISFKKWYSEYARLKCY